VDIAGATSAVYVLQPVDAGAHITVAVTATSSAGSRTLAAAPTAPISPAAPYIATLPIVTGTAQLGQTLAGTTGSWVSSPSSYALQWRRCDSFGGGCADIAGATNATYTLTAADVGSTIRLSVVATNAGGSDAAASAPFPSAGTVRRGNQTIILGALVARTYGDPDFAVSATASSGLPVSFAASGNCSVTGATVHITGAGSCTITASQPGNAAFDPAPNVAEAFSIAKSGQTISFGSLPNKGYGDSDFTANATASSGLTVSFAASGACTVSGATIHLTRTGSCTIAASQPGNANYEAGTTRSQSFLVLCRVPQVVGKNLRDARAAILKRGCRTGTIRYTYSHTRRKGRVSSQSRLAGRLVPPHTAINLVVSRGRRP
jgi:hypothetical protein